MNGGGTELAVPHAPIEVHVAPPTPFNRGMLAVQASATAVFLAGGFGILIGAAAQDEHKSSTPTSNTLLGGGAILMGTGVLVMTVSSLLATLVGTGTVRVGPRSAR